MTDRLLDILVTIGMKYQTEKIDLLVKKLEAIDRMDDFFVVSSSLKGWLDRDDLTLLESACKEEIDISTMECVAVLKSSNRTRTKILTEQKVEIVWTSPSTPLVSTRKTEQVLLETIEVARKELFIVSYVAYDVDSIVTALSKAVARGVKLEILMESTADYGGRINMDSIALFQRELPGAILYWWNEPGASVHAKCAVSDGNVAFVTSANLTGAAMEKNMELGIKIEGGEVPKRLHEHLKALVMTKTITKVE